MKKFTLLLSLTMVLNAYCGTSASSGAGSGASSADSSINLDTELDTLGNSVNLPSNADVSGIVVDTDGNGSANGLDLDGNQSTAEVIYISGSLGKASESRASSRGFYFSSNPEITYYFVVSSGLLAFSTDAEGTNNKVKIIVDESTGEVTGIDRDGDGSIGSADDTSISGIVIVYASSNPVVALFSAVPADPSLPDTQLSFSVSNVDSYRYSLDGGAYSASFPVSSPFNITVMQGSHTVKVLGTKNGQTQAENRPTTYTFLSAYYYNISVNNAASAVDLWAVTTVYQTSGFESEKVQLVETTPGTFTGSLVSTDSNSRNIIVFDDVVKEDSLVLGDGISTPVKATGNYQTVSNDGFFSPCWNGSVNESGTDKSLWDITITGTVTGDFTSGSPIVSNVQIKSPRLPVFIWSTMNLTIPTSLTSTNEEVFYVANTQLPGDTVSVNYDQLTTASAGEYCNCRSKFVYAKYSSLNTFIQAPYISMTGQSLDPAYTGVSVAACGRVPGAYLP